ncbi:MAG: hypothetical protein Q7J73_02695, partial [Dehalococcoidales bacterium]|nr:hypothetical protein [Dehalococcoidales bacterium]
MRETKEIESYRHKLICAEGTAQDIANKLRLEESKFFWLTDEILEEQVCPLTNAEFKEIIDLFRSISDAYASEL